MADIILCDYCHRPAALVTGRDLYPHRGDLAEKKFWHCAPCVAYVGCHEGTIKPFGRLANAALRKAKMEVHAMFDPLWKGKMERDQCSKYEARNAAYAWLARQLNIRIEDCHVGMFDEETCWRAVAICGAARFKPRTVDA